MGHVERSGAEVTREWGEGRHTCAALLAPSRCTCPAHDAAQLETAECIRVDVHKSQTMTLQMLCCPPCHVKDTPSQCACCGPWPHALFLILQLHSGSSSLHAYANSLALTLPPSQLESLFSMRMSS